MIQKHTPTDNHLLLAAIREFLDNRHSSDKKSMFYWVPSHVGIPGNEAADTAAKQSLKLEDIQYVPVSRGNQKMYINRFCKPAPPDQTSHSFANYTQRVGSTQQTYPKGITRQLENDIIYARLGYKLYREKPFPRAADPAPCPDCHEPYSYLHHFLQCTEHSASTQQLRADLSMPDSDPEADMQTIIQKSATALIQFLVKVSY